MNIEKLKAEVRAFFSERKKSAKELEKLRQRRDFLQNAPLPRDDVIEIVQTAVSRHEEKVHESFDRWARNVLPKNDPRQTESLCSGINPLNLAQIGDEIVLRSILCVVAKDFLIAEATRAINAADWPDDIGPRRVERARELAKLDAQIASLEETLASLDQEASAAGLQPGGGRYAK